MALLGFIGVGRMGGPMASRLLTLWAMGENRHAAPGAGREDFRDSLYVPGGPDTVIDVLQ